MLQWIGHFPKGRRQSVVVGGAFSGWADILSGVPQGSVLGPVLFVCFINDMPENIASFLFMYADDTKLFSKVNSKDEADLLQNDLDEFLKWGGDWQLGFKIEKCKVMHLGGRRNNEYGYSMASSDTSDRIDLEKTVLEKDLGVWVSNTLKPGEHVAHAVSTANRVLVLIKRTFTYMDVELMKQLYTSLVRPHLEYGNVVWHPYLKKDIEMLERVQHRATRIVPGLSKFSYEERLRILDLPTLEYRRNRGDAIEVFKYLHGKYTVDATEILPRHQTTGMTTRGNDMKLMKRSCNGQIRANVFGNRVCSAWNYLHQDVVSTSSDNCFKE